MRIGPKLLLNSVLVSTFAVLVTMLLIGGMAYNYGRQNIENQTKDHLTLVLELKADSIQRYFDGLVKQAIIFSKTPSVINAMQDLDQSFFTYAKQVSSRGMNKYKDEVIKHYIDEFSRDYANNTNGRHFDATPYLNTSNPSTFALQYNYIFNNPYGIDLESKLENVDDGSDYSRLHAKYHPILRELKELFDFEDIFLVDPDSGDIVYSVAKGLDFTTSLVNGPYSQTELGAAFRRANANDNSRIDVLSDFAPYSPSNDDQAAFIATPIFNQDKKIGILIFQINAKTVNRIMTSEEKWSSVGLGATGESYLVDEHKHMLTDSRVFVQNPKEFYSDLKKQAISDAIIKNIQDKSSNFGLLPVNTYGVDQALQGQTGFGVYKDYLGVNVFSSYAPINVQGNKWAIISEIDQAEALAPLHNLAKEIILSLLAILIFITLFSTVVGIGLAKQISVPIQNLSAELLILAKTRDLTKRLDDSNAADDEIGSMIHALNKLIANFQQTCQETISSTQKVQSTAHKLMVLADEIDARDALHKDDGYENVHEKTEAIKEAGDNLEELSARLQMLSRQFKVFEQESERSSSW